MAILTEAVVEEVVSSQVPQKLIAKRACMPGFDAGSGCSECPLFLWVSHRLREKRKNSKSIWIVNKIIARVEETV